MKSTATSTSSSTSTNCLITLVDTPINQKYTQFDNIVKTDIQIDFKAREKICYINCGLLGSVEVSLNDKKKRYDPNKDKIVYDSKVKHDNHVFLNCETNFPLDEKFRNPYSKSKYETFTPPVGKILKKQFKFRIPNSDYLPSSYKSIIKTEGEYTISYQVYVEIYKLKGLINKKPKLFDRFITEITYQSGSDHNTVFPKPILDYESTQIYKNKVKKFYFDKYLNELVPSSITRNHRKARFFMQFWNEDYRNENYHQITKSIPLKLNLQINSLFDVYLPIIEQFKTVLVADLNSVGINSNQTTDFVFNGQSTHLGVFKIVSLSIKFHYNISIKCKNRFLQDENTTDILDTNFNEIIFDIKDLKFYKSTKTYNKELTPEELIESSEVYLNQSIMDIMKDKTFLCTGKVTDWFDTTVNLKFIWTISDAMSQERTFEILTSATPDNSSQQNRINRNINNSMENDDIIDAEYINNNSKNNMTYLNRDSYSDDDRTISSSKNPFAQSNEKDKDNNSYNREPYNRKPYNREPYREPYKTNTNNDNRSNTTNNNNDNKDFKSFNESYDDSVETVAPPAYTDHDFDEISVKEKN